MARSIERRLTHLEGVYADAVARVKEGFRERIRSEVYSRLSFEEKRAYASALKRALDSYEESEADDEIIRFDLQDRPIVKRVEELCEKVARELTA